VPPSSAPAETELQRLSSFSAIVADTVVPERVREVRAAATAAVVSHGSLLRSLATPSREFEAALTGALAYDKCRLAGGGADTRCIMDKALVNLGADLAAIVSGRVSTEIDARLARDAAACVTQARKLAALYSEMGVPKDRLLFRLPATWEALQAVRTLEADGLQCHVHDVYTLVQAAAAAHAGAAVLQPSVTTLSDYYVKHPNAAAPGVGGARGTRADAGALTMPGDESRAAAAGRNLVAATLAYVRAHALPSKLMAHCRTAADVRALAGADFLLAPLPVLSALAAGATAAGYNDGIVGAAQGGGAKESSPLAQRALAEAAGVAASFSAGGAFSGERAEFDAALQAGPAGELLDAALARACASAERAESHFRKMWPPAGGM
jgi:transaldolase